MSASILEHIEEKAKEGKKQLAILIDPDKGKEDHLKRIAENATKVGASFFLVGGSLLAGGDLESTISCLKKHCNLPVIIFPGSSTQISKEADAILFLSLLSSRNPEMLIGQQVIAAPYVKQSGLEAIATSYLIVESGEQTTASYMSNSNPIPANKNEIAACTALAGEYLGKKITYLDGGSGAQNPVPEKMIKSVRETVNNTIFVGGGINTIEKASQAFNAGADVVVIGNAFENDPSFLVELKSILG